MMDKPQNQGPPGANVQQQRAQSFSPLQVHSEHTEIMGRTWRTPSPAQEQYYASGSELTPTEKSNFGRAMILETPPGSPQFDFAAPATPASKQTTLNGFGLLTPKTPNFGDLIVQPPVSPSDSGTSSIDTRAVGLPIRISNQDAMSEGHDVASIGGDITDLDSPPPGNDHIAAQQQIQDAALAASLAQEPNTLSKRRSTRLAVKEVAKAPTLIAPIAVVPEKSAKISKPGLAVQFTKAVPAESSFTAEANVQLSPDLNPALMTLDWELQYPPGGSTHPSYAYPHMDPRLFFNPTHVPVVNGLPTVFQVPPLVLPMGWRHISWSGFLPIVFDPYHQGFKLTPVGPLPLTCEEVQQGGLAKYVPGGEAHPEAGLLPDVTALGDGSDEVYNFEDVDWVLPWPKGETFTPPVEQFLGNSAAPSAQAKPKQAVAIAPSHCYEARDCPDNIVDIDDAWRWLKDKEVRPDMIYIATPRKTWQGTGIHRTSRKRKAPIASFMGMISSDTNASADDPLSKFLVNQNGREFCPFSSVATPVHVKITFLNDIEITLVELLCYFPNHYMWRKAADRLVRAGLSASDIQNFINWSRSLHGDAVKQSSGIYGQIAFETEETEEGKKRVKIVREPETESPTYTTEGWTYTSSDLTDYPLLGLAHGLNHLPKGPDAGPLTAMMKWCREQGRYTTLLSEVPELLDAAGIQPLIEPGESGDPDKEVIGRYAKTLREDRKRVLDDAKERRAAEGEEVSKKRKRVKTE